MLYILPSTLALPIQLRQTYCVLLCAVAQDFRQTVHWFRNPLHSDFTRPMLSWERDGCSTCATPTRAGPSGFCRCGLDPCLRFWRNTQSVLRLALPALALWCTVEPLRKLAFLPSGMDPIGGGAGAAEISMDDADLQQMGKLPLAWSLILLTRMRTTLTTLVLPWLLNLHRPCTACGSHSAFVFLTGSCDRRQIMLTKALETKKCRGC